MSIFSKVARLATKATRIPGVKTIARAVPGLGTALAVYEGVKLGSELLSPKSTPSPSFTHVPDSATQLPQFSLGSTTVPMGSTSGPGLLPRGPGGKLQFPWKDPAIPEYLKKFAIDDGWLKLAVRAPRGYVVVRDKDGRPFGVNKEIAKAFKVWKPKKKPPISVTDWESLKRANSTVRKLKSVVKMSKVVQMPTRRRVAAKSCA